MYNEVYKNWSINIDYKEQSSNAELVLTLRNNELKRAMTIFRKCSKTTVDQIDTYTNLFGRVSNKEKYNTYNDRETTDELITEARVIIDMFCEMENVLTEKIENKLMQIKLLEVKKYVQY